MRDLLAAKIDLPHSVVRLNLLNRPLTNDRPFMEDGDDAGDLPDEFHVMFDHDDRMLFGQRL